MKRQENAEKLLEKFADITLLNGKRFTFSAYALEHKDHHYSGKEGISYLLEERKVSSYFVAEVAIELSPRGGWSLYQHFFQLDLASIKHELNKIATIDQNSILYQSEGIANFLAERYFEIVDSLIDYNGEKDNYAEIAAMIFKYRASVAGVRFSV